MAVNSGSTNVLRFGPVTTASICLILDVGLPLRHLATPTITAPLERSDEMVSVVFDRYSNVTAVLKVLFKLAIQRKICAFFDLPQEVTEFECDAHYTTDEDDLRSLFGR